MKIRFAVKTLFQRRAVILAALLLGAQILVYAAAKPIAALLPKVDMSLPIDARIPYVPAFFLPYLGCFLYWPLMYLYIAALGGRRAASMAATSLCSSVVFFALFVLVPTEIERPAELGGGLFGWLARLAYTADTPYNLFPSYHCFASWLCFLGVRGAKEAGLPIKLLAFFAALLVFASTMLVKQHYFVDFIPSVLIAELFWLLSWKTALYKPFERMINRIDTLLGG